MSEITWKLKEPEIRQKHVESKTKHEFMVSRGSHLPRKLFMKVRFKSVSPACVDSMGTCGKGPMERHHKNEHWQDPEKEVARTRSQTDGPLGEGADLAQRKQKNKGSKGERQSEKEGERGQTTSSKRSNYEQISSLKALIFHKQKP